MPVLKPQTVVITGASSGLGEALALAYATSGRTLLLIARNEDRLSAVAQRCRDQGASVETAVSDTTDAATIATVVTGFDAKSPIDLLIANAGIYLAHGPNGQMESTADIATQVSTNLIGTANVVHPTVQLMRARKRGHIAIVSSLAALQPLADAPGYSASKAGLLSYGEALQEFLIPDKIRVSMVYPGHIETAQVLGHVGNLPHIMKPTDAAARIKRGLDAGRTTIALSLIHI